MSSELLPFLHVKYDNLCAAAGTIFQPFALETTGGHGASTKAVYYLFNNHLRDSGVPGEALKRKLKKDISFALRRGTIAQVTTLLPLALDRQATSDERLVARPARRRGRAQRP